MLLLVAAPALADPTTSYYSWCWNGFSSGSQPAVLAPSPSTSGSGTASLSGYVYLDVNTNHEKDSVDWGIPDAQIAITRLGDSAPIATVLTGVDGSYRYSGLSAGTYSLSMVTTPANPGLDDGKYRSILADNGKTLVNIGSDGAISANAYTGVALADNQIGTNFNFAQAVYPMGAISKRALKRFRRPQRQAGDVVPVLSATSSLNPCWWARREPGP